MPKIACHATRVALASGDDLRIVSAPTGRHLATCLQCQAEAARFRKIGRALAALADHREPAPDGLAEAVARRVGDSTSAQSPVVAPAAARSAAAKTAAVAGTVVSAVGAALVVRMLRSRAVT